MSRIVYDGKIDGTFGGFNDQALFKMRNGTYWIQARYEYWYHYEYCPDATIVEENGQYEMTVAGRSVLVRRVTDVVESRIDGEFNGWDGTSVYKLQNGQVWRQNVYKYEYKYAYAPSAVVYGLSNGHRMSVEGTNAEVQRIE